MSALWLVPFGADFAQMTCDSVDGVQDFFGGFDPSDASTLDGNTVECR